MPHPDDSQGSCFSFHAGFQARASRIYSQRRAPAVSSSKSKDVRFLSVAWARAHVMATTCLGWSAKHYVQGDGLFTPFPRDPWRGPPLRTARVTAAAPPLLHLLFQGAIIEKTTTCLWWERECHATFTRLRVTHRRLLCKTCGPSDNSNYRFGQMLRCFSFNVVKWADFASFFFASTTWLTFNDSSHPTRQLGPEQDAEWWRGGVMWLELVWKSRGEHLHKPMRKKWGLQ